nr:hypothetical protein [Phormidium sp. FACHB-592]
MTSTIFTVCLWLVLVSFLWSIGKAATQGWTKVQRLHQVPCSRCTFFTHDYHLKCPVHPYKALSEEAINCLDYKPAIKLSLSYRSDRTNSTVK